VTLDDDTGVVEDIRLMYTFLRTGEDARLIVPNERLAGSVLRNDSIVTDTVAIETQVWIPHDVDEARAVQAIDGLVEGATARVGDVTPEGVFLTLAADPVGVRERARREAELRASALSALRSAGLR
jgi:small-conductance mechanosensitive channel